MRGELLAIAGAPCASLYQQVLRAVDSPPHVWRRGRVRQHLACDFARLDQLVRTRLERPADAPVGRGSRRVRFRFRLAELHQDARDILRAQRTEPETRTPREDGWQHRVRTRGDQEEDRRRRRLLERFEQRMLRRDDERIRLIDDDCAPPALEWPVSGAIDELANLVNLYRSGVAGFDDEHVRVDVPRDARARRALPARVEKGLGVLGTIQRLRGRDGGQTLADAVRAREEQAGRQRVGLYRPRKQPDNAPVADDVAKRHACTTNRSTQAVGLLPGSFLRRGGALSFLTLGAVVLVV